MTTITKKRKYKNLKLNRLVKIVIAKSTQA